MANPDTSQEKGSAYVDAIIKYPERAAEGGRIWGNKDFNFKLEDHRMRIRNARLENPNFATRGFALLHRTTDIDFADKQDVERRWQPQVKQLVKELTGASDVFTFLGILRGGEQDEAGGPALMAHVDFDGDTLRGWIAKLAPERAQELTKKRLVNINVWTPVRLVENMPLGVCDASSIEAADLMRVSFGKEETKHGDEFAGGFDSRGFVLAFNANHRWFYYPKMQPDEALAFRLCDTGDPSGHMTAHTAFVDPTSVPGSPKRMSYEIRTIAVLN